MEEDSDLTPNDGQKVLEAYFCLTRHFSQYVKEMDPALWKRAVDYAKTFTNIEGITLFYEGEMDED